MQAGGAAHAAIPTAAVCLTPTPHALRLAVLYGCPPVYTGTRPPPLANYIQPPYVLWVPVAMGYVALLPDALAQLGRHDVTAMREAVNKWRAALTGCNHGNEKGAEVTWADAAMLEIANRMPQFSPRVSQWTNELLERAGARSGGRHRRNVASSSMPAMSNEPSQDGGASNVAQEHSPAASHRSNRGTQSGGGKTLWQPMGIEEEADESTASDDVCLFL